MAQCRLLSVRNKGTTKDIYRIPALSYTHVCINTKQKRMHLSKKKKKTLLERKKTKSTWEGGEKCAHIHTHTHISKYTRHRNTSSVFFVFVFNTRHSDATNDATFFLSRGFRKRPQENALSICKNKTRHKGGEKKVRICTASYDPLSRPFCSARCHCTPYKRQLAWRERLKEKRSHQGRQCWRPFKKLGKVQRVTPLSSLVSRGSRFPLSHPSPRHFVHRWLLVFVCCCCLLHVSHVSFLIS